MGHFFLDRPYSARFDTSLPKIGLRGANLPIFLQAVPVRCDICELTVTCQVTYESHLKGKAHKKRAVQVISFSHPLSLSLFYSISMLFFFINAQGYILCKILWEGWGMVAGKKNKK